MSRDPDDLERESERCPNCDVKAGCFCMHCSVCGKYFRRRSRASVVKACEEHRCASCFGEGDAPYVPTFPSGTKCVVCGGTGLKGTGADAFLAGRAIVAERAAAKERARVAQTDPDHPSHYESVFPGEEGDVHPDPLITVFACGPDPKAKHVCDHNGPEVVLRSQETGRPNGSSSSCSVCGSTAFDRSFWEDP